MSSVFLAVVSALSLSLATQQPEQPREVPGGPTPPPDQATTRGRVQISAKISQNKNAKKKKSKRLIKNNNQQLT